jgi:hypothetical protein
MTKRIFTERDYKEIESGNISERLLKKYFKKKEKISQSYHYRYTKSGVAILENRLNGVDLKIHSHITNLICSRKDVRCIEKQIVKDLQKGGSRSMEVWLVSRLFWGALDVTMYDFVWSYLRKNPTVRNYIGFRGWLSARAQRDSLPADFMIDILKDYKESGEVPDYAYDLLKPYEALKEELKKKTLFWLI